MTTVMQAMFMDFLCITPRFIGEIKITLHYINREVRSNGSFVLQITMCLMI